MNRNHLYQLLTHDRRETKMKYRAQDGATINLDNEENYHIRKLFTPGLGMVCISNQAPI